MAEAVLRHAAEEGRSQLDTTETRPTYDRNSRPILAFEIYLRVLQRQRRCYERPDGKAVQAARFQPGNHIGWTKGLDQAGESFSVQGLGPKQAPAWSEATDGTYSCD